MSKIGKKKILIPKEVNVSINGDNIDIKGPYSSKKINLDTKLFEINISENKELSIKPKKKNDYFKKMNLQIAILRPLSIVNRENEYDVKCSVKGGGFTGQAGAIIHGIARAIVQYEPELKPTLKKEKLTTRDSRSVERKKYGHRKARRSFQFSKR